MRWQARREGLHHLLLQLPSTRVHVPRSLPYVRLYIWGAAMFVLPRKTRPQYLWKRVILIYFLLVYICTIRCFVVSKANKGIYRKVELIRGP